MSYLVRVLNVILSEATVKVIVVVPSFPVYVPLYGVNKSYLVKASYCNWSFIQEFPKINLSS